MPYSGTGSYVREHNWVADKAGAIPVTASRMDTEHNGFATGLSTAICRDGQSTTTASIPFAAGVSVFDGLLATPGLNFTSDPDCGIYRETANTWHLVVAGVSAIELTTALITLSKPLDVPSIAVAAGEVSGNWSVNGDFDVNTAAFTVDGTTGNTAILGTLQVGGAQVTHAHTTASTLGPVWRTEHNKSSAGAINDIIWTADFYGMDAGSTLTNYGRMECVVEDPTSASGEEAKFRWRIARAGLLATTGGLILSGTGNTVVPSLGPVGDNGMCLGTPALGWAHLYLGTGGTLNWDNSNMVITHSAGNLSVSGGTFTLLNNFIITSAATFQVAAGSGFVSIAGNQVLQGQGAAVADATAGNHLTLFNVLLARLRAHGLIDT